MTPDSAILARFAACPLVQAPMVGVSTPQLAAAVSNAGALGSIGIGASSVAQARQMLHDTRALTDGPFNVNVFCHAPARRDAAREQAWLQHLAPLFEAYGAPVPAALDEIYRSFVDDPAACAMLLQERPAVVSFHFGLPAAEQVQALRRAGIYTLATATSLAEAQRIEQAGVDAIVAQGVEAGGHRGVFDPGAQDEGLSTAVLVRLLAKATRLPLIAAGGIMDGQGVRAALDLGAVAAQLGTAFVLCPESAANAAYRAKLAGPGAHSTRLSSAISGRPARGIVNRLFAHGEALPGVLPADYPVAYDAAKQLHAAAARQGVHAFAAHWAGQGAPLARALPAEALVRVLMDELGASGRPGDSGERGVRGGGHR